MFLGKFYKRNFIKILLKAPIIFTENFLEYLMKRNRII
ncbi:hypothetical protein HMPREF0378_1031 [Eubacterium nodatum ATCC 33099]|nr:hypothetical protein HMPREF0378_1031 [Eubacterium nodatum ATCC 33099]